MQNAVLLLIPLAVSLVLAAWHSGAIQRLVNRQALRLPQWAQPFPPILLASLATVAESLISGVEPSATTATLLSAATVGLYHVVKRWGGTWIVSAVRVAVLNKRAGLGSIVLVMVLGCTPAAGPRSPVDVARVRTVALQITGITHQALAAAITALPVTADLAPWRKAVETLEQADAAIVKADATLDVVCQQLPVVREVAVLVSCDECLSVTDTISGLVCTGAK